MNPSLSQEHPLLEASNRRALPVITSPAMDKEPEVTFKVYDISGDNPREPLTASYKRITVNISAAHICLTGS